MTTAPPGCSTAAGWPRTGPAPRPTARSTSRRRASAWPGPSASAGGELDELLIGLERDLWVLMAELATDPANHGKLTDGASRVTAEMVTALEARIDDDRRAVRDARRSSSSPARTGWPPLLDVARTVARRAERRRHLGRRPAGPGRALPQPPVDLLWTLARWQEGGSLVRATSDSA